MFAFSPSTVKKTRGETITVIQTPEKPYFKHNLLLPWVLENSLKLRSGPVGGQLNLQVASPSSSSPSTQVKSSKSSTASAGAKESHQIAQNHPTDSSDNSSRLSPHPTSDPAWWDWQQMPAEEHEEQHGLICPPELLFFFLIKGKFQDFGSHHLLPLFSIGNCFKID